MSDVLHLRSVSFTEVSRVPCTEQQCLYVVVRWTWWSTDRSPDRSRSSWRLKCLIRSLIGAPGFSVYQTSRHATQLRYRNWMCRHAVSEYHQTRSHPPAIEPNNIASHQLHPLECPEAIVICLAATIHPTRQAATSEVLIPVSRHPCAQRRSLVCSPQSIHLISLAEAL